MSPNQYRALERLADGPAILTDVDHQAPGRIHPATAEALERRGLASVERDRIETFTGKPVRVLDYAVITGAGFDLLADNPREATG